MKNINYINLFQNIARCIVAYPLFLIALVISIPINVVGWFTWAVELMAVFMRFIFTGKISLVIYSTIGDLITDFSFYDLMFVIVPITLMLTEKINEFNKTLKPIKRS